MTTRSDNWLLVDRKGLAQVLAQKGAARVLMEIPANAFDTKATDIAISFSLSKTGFATLVVTDDDPDGFSSLIDAYTLYAPSTRKGDAQKRGRFGLGDKEVLALCTSARVESTSGTVIFDEKGRRNGKTVRDRGSEITAVLPMTKADAKEFESLIRQIILPANVKVTFNGEMLEHREALRTFTVSLPTVLADAEGNLRPTARKTPVELFEVAPGEKPMIYELGMPVVEHDGRWHVNVGQKVPLNSDRDNVPPAYLRKIRTAVLDNTLDLIDSEDASSVWVRDAFTSASPEAQREVIRGRFGDKVVAFDPSDLEANKRALDAGYNVVGGRSLSKDEWAAAKSMDLIPAAGKIMPSGVLHDPEGKPPIPEDKWTPGMVRVVEYAKKLGRHILGIDIRVRIVRGDIAETYGATFGPAGELTLNLTRLSHRWFNEPVQEDVDSLLIHEFAHHRALDHFSDAFIRACCDGGARIRSFKDVL